MTALKRARKGKSHNLTTLSACVESSTAERGFFSAGGEGSEGVNTPGRDLQSPAPYGMCAHELPLVPALENSLANT